MHSDLFSDLVNHGFLDTEANQLIENGELLELPTRHILNHQESLARTFTSLLKGYAMQAISLSRAKSSVKNFIGRKTGLSALRA